MVGGRLDDNLKAALESHAAGAPEGPPPDVLPDDRESPWGPIPAARAALGLLLEGGEPAPHLWEVADYLLTFAPQAGSAEERRLLYALNGTALALCGYVSEGLHAEANLWRLTGATRLATALHAETVRAGPAADGLRAVVRLGSESELPVLADLLSLHERIFGELIGHDRAEHIAVPEALFPDHMAGPLPPEELGPMLAGRRWQTDLAPPDHLFEPDIDEADDALRGVITLHAHMHVRHSFGRQVDWHARLFDDVESTVSLNTHACIRNLAAAYAQTGNEAYAARAAELLWSFRRQAPPPNYRQLQGPWRTLEVGNRQCLAWPSILGWLSRSPAMDAATHAMLAASRLEHIRYGLAFNAAGGNWYQVEDRKSVV